MRLLPFGLFLIVIGCLFKLVISVSSFFVTFNILVFLFLLVLVKLG